MTTEELKTLNDIQALLRAGQVSAASTLLSQLIVASSPAPVAPPIVTQPVNLSKMVDLDKFHYASRYERFQRLMMLYSSKINDVSFNGIDLAVGGAERLLLSTRYTLLMAPLVGGVTVEVAAVTLLSPASRAVFKNVSVAGLEQGWYKIIIGGLGLGETSPMFFCFVHKGLPVDNTFMPVSLGTKGLHGTHAWAVVPAKPAPVPRPILTKRLYTPPTPTLPRKELHCEDFIVFRGGDQHFPNINKDGVLSTFDPQSYTWSGLHAKLPTQPCYDGPRGIGSASYVTHVWLSVAKVPINGVEVDVDLTYFSDSWRIARVTPNGKILTLVGWRHIDNMQGHWEDSEADKMKRLELVGDWSAIPEALRGFREIWGFDWDERTFEIDQTSPLVDGFHTHKVGVTLYVADSFNNRILKVQFDPKSHETPPKVTLFATLKDPWDLATRNGRIFVSERQSHRICEYDMDTGALVRVLVQGMAMATIDVNREVRVTGTLYDRRLQPCVAPEGVYLQDDWLYFASKAQGQVRRVWVGAGTNEQYGVYQLPSPALPDGKLQGGFTTTSLTTAQSLAERTKVANRLNAAVPAPTVPLTPDDFVLQKHTLRTIHTDGNTNFAKVTVSDGTFGARGATFTWTWSNAHHGGPEIYGPLVDGQCKPMGGLWNSMTTIGVGTGDWAPRGGYGTAGVAAKGRLISCSMLTGMYRVTKSQPGDQLTTTAIRAGESEYHQRFLHLIHGDDTFGDYGFPPPFGLSANIDAYLMFMGHPAPTA